VDGVPRAVEMALSRVLPRGQAAAQHAHRQTRTGQPARFERGIVVVDGRHVHRGRRHSDPADVARPQPVGRRVGAEQLRLRLGGGAPAAGHPQGDDPVPPDDITVGVDAPPRPPHRDAAPRHTPLDPSRRERTGNRQHVAGPEVPRIAHLARMDGAHPGRPDAPSRLTRPVTGSGHDRRNIRAALDGVNLQWPM
jgi:hypothetical protein